MSKVENLHSALCDLCRRTGEELHNIERKYHVNHYTTLFGSGALGFDGVGTSAMEQSEVTVLSYGSSSYVYFGGTFCYYVLNSANFADDYQANKVAFQSKARERYTDAMELVFWNDKQEATK